MPVGGTSFGQSSVLRVGVSTHYENVNRFKKNVLKRIYIILTSAALFLDQTQQYDRPVIHIVSKYIAPFAQRNFTISGFGECCM